MQEVGRPLWRWASARSRVGPVVGGSLAMASGDHQIMALLTSLPLLVPLGAWGVEAVVDFSIEIPAMDPDIDEENREKLETFSGVWQEIFKWSFFSAVLIHLMAAVTAFFTLRKHKYGRFFSACLMFLGVFSSFLMCSITSATIAFVITQAGIEPIDIYLVICGITQTILLVFFALTRLLPTL